MRHSSVMFAAICLLLLACTDYPCQRSATLDMHQAQQDFRELRELIMNGHPLNFTPQRDVAAVFDSQYQLLSEGMTILEFYRVIAPAVAAVNCGHTRLSFPDCTQEDIGVNGSVMPFKVIVTRDSLVIVDTYDVGQALPRGGIVLSINGKPVSEIIGRIKSCLYSDGTNETFKYFLMNQNFGRYYLELIEDTATFEIDFVNPNAGERSTVTVAASSLQEIRERRKAQSTEPPINRIIETDIDSMGAHAMLKIRFFDFYDNLDDFAGKIDSFFKDLSRRNVPSLILDLRGNDGGDPYSSVYLLGYLVGEPFRYYAPHSTFFYRDLKSHQPVPDNHYEGELYVLVDGGCYSTTGHFLSVLRTRGKGLFIGEETGGSYVCNGGYREHRLPNCGIELLLPHTAFIADARGLSIGRGITPDVHVDYSTEDIVSEADPVMDSALSIIRNHRRAVQQ